jgi:hypothetical protein
VSIKKWKHTWQFTITHTQKHGRKTWQQWNLPTITEGMLIDQNIVRNNPRGITKGITTDVQKHQVPFYQR